jgi:hypothetical protein
VLIVTYAADWIDGEAGAWVWATGTGYLPAHACAAHIVPAGRQPLLTCLGRARGQRPSTLGTTGGWDAARCRRSIVQGDRSRRCRVTGIAPP